MRRFPKTLLKEFAVFKKLTTPAKIQDFLEQIPINFEEGGETYYSPREALKHKRAHCMEGALIAAAALWYQGKPPLLLDLKTSARDVDHVVALFRHRGKWGAISKTNHAVLRYRDPIYRDVRELAMSYFHEYFLDNGKKTLLGYSKPFDLSRHNTDWLATKENLQHIVDDLDDSPHFPIVGKKTGPLRKASRLEIAAGKLVEWKKKRC